MCIRDRRFEDGTRWNKQALAGMVQAQVEVAAPAANPPAGADAAAAANAATAELLAGLRIHGLDVDLKLGPNRVRAQGEIGGADGALTLDAQAPQLDAFWPGVPGGADVKGKLGGTVASHRGEISAGYNPPKPRPCLLYTSDAADEQCMV